MPVHLITPPEDEPVTLEEARLQLRLDNALDDDQLNRFIAAARGYLEEICWRGLVSQEWELVEPHFPSDHCGCGLPFPWGIGFADTLTRHQLRTEAQGIELPKGNLVEVASVKYTDANGVIQTLVENTDYVVDTVSLPGRVRLAYGKSWPGHREQWDAVRIIYTVGWEVEDVPAELKQALLLLVAEMYENRVPSAQKNVASIDFAVDSLIRPHRLVRHT